MLQAMSQAALYGEPFIYLIPKRKKKNLCKGVFFPSSR